MCTNTYPPVNDRKSRYSLQLFLEAVLVAFEVGGVRGESMSDGILYTMGNVLKSLPSVVLHENSETGSTMIVIVPMSDIDRQGQAFPQSLGMPSASALGLNSEGTDLPPTVRVRCNKVSTICEGCTQG